MVNGLFPFPHRFRGWGAEPIGNGHRQTFGTHPTGRDLGKNKIRYKRFRNGVRYPWLGLADLNVAAWCDSDGDGDGVGVVVGQWVRKYRYHKIKSAQS